METCGRGFARHLGARTRFIVAVRHDISLYGQPQFAQNTHAEESAAYFDFQCLRRASHDATGGASTPSVYQTGRHGGRGRELDATREARLIGPEYPQFSVWDHHSGGPNGAQPSQSYPSMASTSPANGDWVRGPLTCPLFPRIHNLDPTGSGSVLRTDWANSSGVR